ncbi:hypothetical protein [Bartonella sp. CL436QHHD]|uniref:hypothetical protein n=1 Tax=Bartonella sp. CL436QHHD TaxID=3243531 RepID=UPI0035CFF35B
MRDSFYDLQVLITGHAITPTDVQANEAACGNRQVVGLNIMEQHRTDKPRVVSKPLRVHSL